MRAGTGQNYKTTVTFASPWSRIKKAFARRRTARPTLLIANDYNSNSSSTSTEFVSPISFDTPPVDRGHNEKLAINRLPPEILAEVFIVVCEACDLSDHSWVFCSQVCSGWREIALDIPHLWGHVVFATSEWTRRCIERSKSSLLIVEADVSFPFVRDRVCEVLKLANRVGRISIRCFFLDDQVTQLLGGPFPMLTTLCMESYSPLASPEIPLDPDIQPYPMLRNLQVRSNVAFLPHLPARLVSLEINNGDSEDVGWDTFAAAIQLLTELEILTLRGFAIPSTSASIRRISLPSLRELHLSASPAHCTQFIAALECPQILRYDLDLWVAAEAGSMFQTVLRNLRRPPPKSMFLHRLYGTVGTDYYMSPNYMDVGFFQHVVFGFTYNDVRDLGVATRDICFCWRTPLTDSDLAEIFVAISEIPLLDTVECFLLVDWNTSPQGSWPALLRRLVRLQTLVISGLPASGLLWDLVHELEGSAGDPPFLPDLTEIEVNCVDCSAGGWVTRRPHVNSYIDLDGARFLEVLICYLERRRAKLPKLKVSKCHNYSGAEIKLLRRLVKEVEWDGVGMTLPTYVPNGDEFGALTINHNVLSTRASYQELNLSDEERWRKQHRARSRTSQSNRLDRLYDVMT
ncbi:hypothetical protein DFH07DRAFT_855757 [Mycena maculata]|uniref:F-box domain-containing protein n=1 Tax=Mycena maculata TaxID=230809 RepID=A0AAD7MMX4_9AGAR|nr:hypothetical protein DFH07DRAFT_855757 [Mycena maculata]